MNAAPLELDIALTPRARFDVIDVRAHVFERLPAINEEFPRCLYYSFHTTAGYLDQSLALRLSKRNRGITSYVGAFRALFPEGAGYRHDVLDERTELSIAERENEPLNGDAHLAFMAAGLRTCVTYSNRTDLHVNLVDLDGVYEGRPRKRMTAVIGFHKEIEVARLQTVIPVSGHPVDSVNLKDTRLGLYDQLTELVSRCGVTKGYLRLELPAVERHAGLTVNEYETLLMRHDLTEVLHDPLRFVAEKGRSAWSDPRALPVKTLGYAKYDLVRGFNELVDALGLSESLFERLLARAIAVPAARFLRMKRSVDLLVSDRHSPGNGAIVEGKYQSPILVQWRPTSTRARRVVVRLMQFA